MTDANKVVLSLEPQKEQDPAPDAKAELRSMLAELVGEGKKFTDEEALAKGKVESDKFISQLQEEAKGMRDTIAELQEKLKEATTSRELDDLKRELSRVKEEKETEPVTPRQPSSDNLESLIEKHITERETKATAKANINQTNDELIKRFGDAEKAKAALGELSRNHGLSVDELTGMAAKSPSAFLSLFGVAAKPQAGIDKSSSVQGVVTAPRSRKAELDELRRTNWSKYWSPAIQKEIYQLKAAGEYN